jgi:hypothetical protein
VQEVHLIFVFTPQGTQFNCFKKIAQITRGPDSSDLSFLGTVFGIFSLPKNKGSVLAPGVYHVGSWDAGTLGCPLQLSQWSGTEKGGKFKI